jgi:hypothetical protein
VHVAALAQRVLGRACVLDHPEPGMRLVVRAVDAHHVHACRAQVVDQLRVGRGLGWHGDHDAGVALHRRLAHELDGVGLQQARPLVDADTPVVPRRDGTGRERIQRVEHGVDTAQHVGFAAPQPAQAERAKALLQLAQVALAQREIVEQVARAFAAGRRHLGQIVRELGLHGECARTQRFERGDDGFQAAQQSGRSGGSDIQ